MSNSEKTVRSACELAISLDPRHSDRSEYFPSLDSAYTEAYRTLWALYMLNTEKFDKELVESWKGDTDGILIFVRALAPCSCMRRN